jgi:hypothetical protein
MFLSYPHTSSHVIDCYQEGGTEEEKAYQGHPTSEGQRQDFSLKLLDLNPIFRSAMLNKSGIHNISSECLIHSENVYGLLLVINPLGPS